jgi:hypothetical protein
MSEQPTAWIVMPVVNNEAMTYQAIQDCLAQSGVDVRVLVVLQGAVDFREGLERWAETNPRIFVWSHNPALPSLSATWNLALDFVWEVGGTVALVVNNDVRMRPGTYAILKDALEALDALFVTAVGVRQAEFEASLQTGVFDHVGDFEQRGGPDFSCFLISHACHAKYPFDEGFIPAYCEDLDYHRRLMLGGDGARIFSVNLPYLHYASQTVGSYTPAQREAFAQQVRGSRNHYEKKWGGPVNQEIYAVPFSGEPLPHVTTPELQALVLAGLPAAPVLLFGEQEQD